MACEDEAGVAKRGEQAKSHRSAKESFPLAAWCWVRQEFTKGARKLLLWLRRRQFKVGSALLPGIVEMEHGSGTNAVRAAYAS